MEWRGAGANIGAWSTGGNMNASSAERSGVGPATTALAFGGTPGGIALTEQYNGSTWTAKNVLNTGRQDGASAGTSRAA